MWRRQARTLWRGSSAPLWRHLLLASALAWVWWLLALQWYQDPAVRARGIYIWGDQAWTFLAVRDRLATPYAVAGFVNPPWVQLVMLPLTFLPFVWAVWAQMQLYFILLVLLVRRHGGDTLAVLVVLTSPFALDTAVELNIEWLVVLGMLLPPPYGAPFLLAKPQIGLGYVVGYTPRQLLWWLVGAGAAVLGAWLVWGAWWQDLLRNLETSPVSALLNNAPHTFLGAPLAFALGGVLLLWAWRRRSHVLGVLGWLCFVPYIATYSLMVPFALVTARLPRGGLLVSVGLWVTVYYVAAVIWRLFG